MSMDLTLAQVSGRFDLTPEQTLENWMTVTLLYNPDVIGVTEGARFHAAARSIPGYRPVFVRGSREEYLLVKRGIRVSSKRAIEVIDVGTARDVWIMWANLRIQGERISVIESHWLAHVEGNMGTARNPWRMRAHTRTSRVVAALVRRLAGGRRLSFFMGDLNVDYHRDERLEDPRYPALIFKGERVIPVYAELDSPPRLWSHAGGRLIDWIGRHTQDRRVSALWVKTLSLPYGDHEAVIARYRILK